MYGRIIEFMRFLFALFPITSMVSIAISVPLFLVFSLIPNDFFHISGDNLLEILIVLLLIGYGFRIKRLLNNKYYKFTYLVTLIVTTALFILKWKQIIFLQPALLIIYSLFLEQKLSRIKMFFKDSSGVLAVVNKVYMAIIIIAHFFQDMNIRVFENIFESLYDSLRHINLSEKTIDRLLIILFVFVLTFLLPFVKGIWSIKILKKEKNLSLSSDNVLWNSYFMAYIFSLASIVFVANFFLYTDRTLSLGNLFVILLFMSIEVLMWVPIYDSVLRGGENKNKVISDWTTVILIIVLLVLLEQIESELIGIMTWFLPVLLPVFIGEINVINRNWEEKKHSNTMKKHLYWMQMMSFNTLFVLNVITSLGTKQVLKNGKIQEINSLRIQIISILKNVFQTGNSSDPTLSIFSSLILVIISVVVAYIMSRILIKLITRTYIESSNRYFEN